MRKKTKHWNMKTPPPSEGRFSGSFFAIKMQKIENLTFFGPLMEIMAMHIYIYIYMLWSYYLGQVWPFQVLFSGPSRCCCLSQVVFSQFFSWFEAISVCSVIILCFFVPNYLPIFLEKPFSKKGCKIGFFKFLVFKICFWKSSFFRFAQTL